MPEKADALGVPFGPERRILVEGGSITLADGRRITPDDVLGPLHEGHQTRHCGGYRPHGRPASRSARDADALVIESDVPGRRSRDGSAQFSHMTARRAAELAVKAGVKKLILTHISRRYREKDVIKEAQAIFPNAVVARDFDTFQVKSGRVITQSTLG
ncbi:MAG: hypothetical protein MZV64_00485 [Ignavibacteriales bacterium]|nr:hypothetical protein [Ignavibacteriales bacterium]